MVKYYLIKMSLLYKDMVIIVELIKSITYIAVLGIAAHYIGESLPRRWFVCDRFPFKPYFWENNGKIYNLVGVKRWKNRVPDMSKIMKDMLPKRIGIHATSESVDRLIKETCVAEVVHKILCVLSIGVYFIWKNTVGAILSGVCIICNLPFIIIQRFNRPQLMALKVKLQIREEKKRNAVSDTVM